MNNKYKYILFDWDGCLAETLEVWMHAYEVVFARYGVNPTKQEIAFHFGDWKAPKYFGINDVDGCFKQIDEIVNNDLKKVALSPCAFDLLNDLRKSKHLAILSSTPREILEEALKYNYIYDYFETILAGEDVINHKPNPEVINKGLEFLGGSKDEAVMIGDSRKDIEAAKNAGIDSILFYPKNHSVFYNFKSLTEYKPTYIISNFSEASKYLM